MEHSTVLKISIVIPVYNGANYLAQAIRSCLEQTYPPFEILVIDDASTDSGATEAAARAFGDSIRYIRLESNGGVSAALNRGITHMSGDYFAWLSHDDAFEPHRLEQLAHALANARIPSGREHDVFLTNCFVLTDDAMNTLEEHRELDVLTKGMPWNLLKGCFINGCSSLIHRSLLERTGTFDTGLRCAQDLDYWLRAGMKAFYVHVPLLLTRIRIHPAQVTTTKAALLKSEEDEVILRALHRLREAPVSWPEAARAIYGMAIASIVFWSLLEAFYRCVRRYPRSAALCSQMVADPQLRSVSSVASRLIATLLLKLPRMANPVFLSYALARIVAIARTGISARLRIRRIHDAAA